MPTILERDISFYQAMQEQHRDDLRACHPDDEPRHAKLSKLAENVRKALDAYRNALEAKS
jgi:hypothetical protein